MFQAACRSVHPSARPFSTGLLLASVLLPAALDSCSSGGGGLGSFQTVTSRYAFTSAGALAVEGRWAVVNADEATSLGGTDLNGDMDTNDQATLALDLSGGAEYVAGVAATAAAVLNDVVFLVVDEAIDGDQNNDMDTGDIVLMSWSPAGDPPSFVEVLEPGQDPIVSGGRLWFAVPAALPLATDETTIRYIDPTNPTTVVTLLATTGTTGSVQPSILGEEAGLLFLTLDEALNGDQNGDLDANDSSVLALVETGLMLPELVSVGRAIVASGQTVRARLVTLGEWDVAFLVDEAQEGQNLNGTAPFPLQCSSGPDTDSTDSVLFVLRWDTGGISQTTTPPLNSQLTGASNPLANRILVGSNYFALLSQEASYGNGSGCDLNQDGDFNDLVLRWAPWNDPDNPEGGAALMRQVDVGIPGGALGAIELSDRFVIASPDTVQVGGNPVTASFLAWAEPGVSAIYQDEFFSLDPEGQFVSINLAVDWLSGEASAGRNPSGVLEASLGMNLNAGCNKFAKDTDSTDTLASWLRYNSTNDAIILSGLGWAVQPLNSGMVIRNGVTYFRVSEQSDNFDWNNDGDQADFVLFRSPILACSPTNMGTLNNLANTPAIYTGNSLGGLFFASETAAGADLNGDGVTGGLAARFFRF